MRRRRVLFYHFSRIRLLAKKFTIVILFITTFALMLLNKTETELVEKTSTVATDIVSPVIDVLLIPARTVASLYDYLSELKEIHQENKSLRQENKKLLTARDKARVLEIENKILSNLLNYVPPPEATFVTAKVIAEEGDAFSHSIIVYVGDSTSVRRGQVAMSDSGVVGRVDRVGKGYAKIVLVTDINSKIPVMVERTRVRGILSGDNTLTPKMIFIPLFAELTVGDRIVTSGVAGMFPAGLPVGKISSVEKNNVKIKLVTDLDRLEYVKIVEYGFADALFGVMEGQEVE